MVKSPYNFVSAPSEDEVFKPNWASSVSHDAPFEDGESGEIMVKITAETPIFVRNGHAKGVEENEFSNINGQYFIPATSIKGMLRNVLEIMSFSRMKQVDGSPVYGLRDMANDNYSKNEIRNTKTGWLIFENNKWVIYECKSDRVRISSLVPFASPIIRDSSKTDEITPFDSATAIEKYIALGINNFNNDSYFDNHQVVERTGNIYSKTNVVTANTGKLVLFGSMENKKYDYIFYDKTGTSIELHSQDLVDKSLIIHNGNESSLWDYFLNVLHLTKIPVFYKLEGKKVKHFGFSKLYRLNDSHAISDLEPLRSYEARKKNELDLAQLMFGTTDEVSDALKGRVYFSHAFSENAIPLNEVKREILASPKPSFYPFYLKQTKNDASYSDYRSESATLRGYKRYPTHSSSKNGKYTSEQLANPDIFSKFIPLKEGTVFSFKIRFHNLKKAEIGALLSAITFHGMDNFRHNLGAAKPFGFGKVKFEITKGAEFSKYMPWFEYEINEKLGINWHKNSRILDFFSMARSSKNHSDFEKLLLDYPQIEFLNKKGTVENEFVEYKKAKQRLLNFSDFDKEIEVRTLVDDAFLGTVNQEKLAKIEAKRIKEQEKRALEDRISREIAAITANAKKALEENDFDLARSLYLSLNQYALNKINISDEIATINSREEQHLRYLEEFNQLNIVNQSNDVELITKFLSDFPFSEERQNLEMKLSKLKASSGIPDRLRTLTDFEMFTKESLRWLKKVKDANEFEKFQIEFERLVSDLVAGQIKSEKHRKNWIGSIDENRNWKKVSELISQEKAQELYNQLIN